MAVRNCWDDVMMLPCMGAGAFQNSQSPERCRSRPMMPIRLTRRVTPVWSILLIPAKLMNWCAFHIAKPQRRGDRWGRSFAVERGEFRKNGPGAGLGGCAAPGPFENVAVTASDVRPQADHIPPGGAVHFCSLADFARSISGDRERPKILELARGWAVGPLTGDFNAKRWQPNRRDGGRGKGRSVGQAGSPGACRELRSGNRRTHRRLFGDVKGPVEGSLSVVTVRV